MKKIVACIALTLVFIISATASFLVNDLSAYRHWMMNNRPKIMENFGHRDKDKKMRPSPKGAETSHQDMSKDFRGKDHHDTRPMPQPPANAPKPESPAPAPDNSSEN